MTPTERIPQWAAFWLVDGYDGAALVDLAGLHGDDPREVRDLLPAAPADCGVTPPTADAAAAMEAFTNLAQLYIDGKASARWIVDKVSETLTPLRPSQQRHRPSLGQLSGLDGEWGAGWDGRSDQKRGPPRPGQQAETTPRAPPDRMFEVPTALVITIGRRRLIGVS
jgi:hypothetical protein